MLNFTSFIPDEIKQKAGQALVDFLIDQAEKHASDQITSKIRKWSSKAEFNASVEKAIEKGSERFAATYFERDEDLVVAIANTKDFWASDSVRQALIDLIKQPGAWMVDEFNTVASHFDDVLPERHNRGRVDKAVTFYLRCIVEELWTLPGAKEIREIYALQFQKISAESATKQVALAQQQLEATTQLNADIRQTFSQLAEMMEQNLLPASSMVALPSPKPYHNLPRPDYEQFVGREAELAWLRERLSPRDRAWQIAITGIGGVGKSALALTLGHEYCEQYDQLPVEERFDAIIWISAKEEILTAQGREQATLPDLMLRTLEDIYTAIARTLEREDITRSQPQDQSRIVEKALKEQRTLLLMDNLESVKDERIKPFLRNLPTPTKAIVTSREWLDVADILPLKGLSPEEADQLIIGEATVRQARLKPPQRQRIYELTHGLPLPIRLAVARVAGGESFLAVERWLGDATGDLPEYCIQGQIELGRQRDPNSWELLLACSLFERNAGASLEALGVVTDFSRVDRDQVLGQLQRLFLVNRNAADRYWVLPIVQRYARQYLGEKEDYTILIDRWLQWLTQFGKTYGIELEFKIEDTDRFGQEYPNLLNCIRWCRDQERWAELGVLCECTWPYPYLLGFFHEFEEILLAGQQAASHLQDERLNGRIELQLGRLAMIQGYPKSETYERLQKGEEVAQKYKNWPDLAEAWATKVSLLFEDLSAAEEFGRKIFDLGDQAGDHSIRFLGAIRLSMVETERGNLEKAAKWADEAEYSYQYIPSMRSLTSLLHRRGTIAYRSGDFAQAEKYLSEAMRANTEWGGRRYVAYNKFYLAQIYAAKGNLSLAYQFAEDAIDAFDRFGMNHDKNRVIQFLEINFPETGSRIEKGGSQTG